MNHTVSTDLDRRLWPIYLTELAGHPGDLVPDLRRIQAPGYLPTLHLVPDRSNAAVIAKGKFRAQVTVPVESYIWAFGAYSEQAEGFKVQITDLGTGTPFFSAPIPYNAISGQAAVSGVTFPLHILHWPRLVIEPAILRVEVQNLSASANQIQLVLFAAQPTQPGKARKAKP